jgi:uncharacterized protein (DUF983 family)
MAVVTTPPETERVASALAQLMKNDAGPVYLEYLKGLLEAQRCGNDVEHDDALLRNGQGASQMLLVIIGHLVSAQDVVATMRGNKGPVKHRPRRLGEQI